MSLVVFAKRTVVLALILGVVAAHSSAQTTRRSSQKKAAPSEAEASPSPASVAKKKATPSPSPKTKSPSPTPSPSPKKKRPSASPTPDDESAASPSPARKKPKPSPSPSPEASPESRSDSSSRAAPNATLSSTELAEFEKQPPKVRQLIESALALTAQNLTYTYGSADPANGGMDCSGFVHHVLRENGLKDVPRSSSEQYVWVRKAGEFFAVVSRKSGTFEMEDLQPGDLMFWTGTYSVERDPPVTHAMIYLGTEKRTKKRVMVGASDGRVYEGKSRWGVSVFDFQVETRSEARFVGYGRVPGLR